MYFFQFFFCISILCLFITSAYSDREVLEHIREKGSSSNNFTVQNEINNTFSNNTQNISHQNGSSNSIAVASEGGGIISSTIETHSERERVIEQPITKTAVDKTNRTNNSSLSAKPQENKSVIASLDVAPQKDVEKPSVPKKGVDYHNIEKKLPSSVYNVTNDEKFNMSKPTNTSGIVFNKTVSNVISNRTSPITKVVHKKPLLTESDSDFVNTSKSNEENSKESAISIDQIDPMLVDKKSKRSDYIVPIVAVILSVPLVAILTSVLYKRGADWWQHRNYKRMDFLIEGMYHN